MKKIIAMLMAVMMLVLPMAGLAEDAASVDYYTRAIENGRRVTTSLYVGDIAEDFTGEAAADQIITDLLSALTFTHYIQNNEEYLALGLKQAATGEVVDLLTFGAAVDGDVATIASNLLGGTIAVSAEEVKPLMERLIDMFVLIGLFTEEDAAQLKTELPELIDTAGVTDMEAADIDAVVENLDVTALDYTILTDVLTPILERVETAEVTMQPKNCDPASTVMTVTVTGAEMKALIVSYYRFIQANPELNEVAAYFYDSFMAGFAAGAAVQNPEEIPAFSEALEQAIAEMEETVDIKGDTTIAIYLDDADTPVMAEIQLPEQSVNDAEAVAETVSHTYIPTVTYTRLTMNDSVAHSVVVIIDNVDMTISLIEKGENVTVNFAVAEDGMTMMTMSLEGADRSAENLIAFDMVMNMTVVDDEQYDIVYNAETERYENVKLDPVTIEIGMKITSDTVLNGVDFTSKNAIAISVGGKDYCTIFADSVTSEPGASIVDGEVVRPAALSDADFANWFVGVFNGLQSWGYTLIQALPASVMNLMVQ